MYIYFSIHSNHQHLNYTLNPNFNLHPNIAPTVANKFYNVYIMFLAIFTISGLC